MAYENTGRSSHPALKNARCWLRENQNTDGGWGGLRGTPSSVEETALAVEGLGADIRDPCVLSGIGWLLGQIESGNHRESTPIGFYFAKLWYFEGLYPLTFLVSALGRARDAMPVADGAAIGHQNSRTRQNE
jgi:squalene-hopene/tetraprenyl-beta-curcumene cyclase